MHIKDEGRTLLFLKKETINYPTSIVMSHNVDYQPPNLISLNET